MRYNYIRIFLLALILPALRYEANATHYRGGEVSYRWISGNTYRLSFIIYVDCLNGDQNSIAQDLPVFYSVFNASGVRIHSDSVIGGNPQPLPANFVPGCFHDATKYCGRYTLLQQTITLAPSADGYTIVNQRCCMPAVVTNISDPGDNGLTLSCRLPGSDQIGSGTNSSPVFKPLPPLRLCANTPFAVDYGAADADGDSLAYRLETGYHGGSPTDAKPVAPSVNFTPLSYAPSYSYLQPLGKNGRISLDANTGMLSGTSGDVGQYLVCVSCDEYRAGQKIGTITRSYVIVIANCGRETTAMLQRDSLAINAGLDSLSIVRCGADRTVRFHNQSIGATAWHWDFGVAGSSADTSSEAEPEFTYPAAGSYPITLIAYGPNCSDTLLSTALLSDDVIQADFSVSGGVCLFDSVSLTDLSNANGSMISRHLWQSDAFNISGNPASAVLSESGLLTIRHTIVSEHGCVAAAQKSIDVREGNISLGSDTTVVVNSTLYITASGGASYNWMAVPPADFNNYIPGAAMQEILTTSVGKDFVFVVTGKDAQGCGGRDTIRVAVSDQNYVFVPTAFSPNGDGHNDYLKGRIAGFLFLSFSVYNRSGNEVFKTSDSQTGWDGRYKGQEAAMDTYYWMLRVKSVTSGSELVFSSDVVLVR